MAKAKKTPASGETKLAGKKKSTPVTPAAAPLVDTTMAAQSAAKQLVAGRAAPLAFPPAGRESASFKQMKHGISNPAATGIDSLLDKTAGPGSRKPNLPYAGPGKSTGGGRNQTFGADVNRTGVPRRTSGG